MNSDSAPRASSEKQENKGHDQCEDAAWEQRHRRDKARAVEDGEHGRQLNLVVTVMQPCDDCAYQKTADNAGVERGDAEDRALALSKDSRDR